MKPTFHGNGWQLTFDDQYGDEPPESYVFTLSDTSGHRAEPGEFWFSIPDAILLVRYFQQLVDLHEDGHLDNVHADLLDQLREELQRRQEDAS